MRKRDLARMERRIDRERKDREQLAEFAEGVPSFTPRSDGSGREQNGRLRALDDLNRHGSLPCDETANEARARLLSPTNDRLAREAAEASEPHLNADGFPWWMDLVLSVAIGLAAVVLLWAAVEWWLMVEGTTR